jgi:hypothetical protein
MLYTFFKRALFVSSGMVVVGCVSYYLLAGLFQTKSPNPVVQDSLEEISLVEGVVKNIHTTPTTTTPARVEIETPQGIIKNVVIQNSSQCAAIDIFDVRQLTAGDSVEVRGSVSKRGDVLPCSDLAHYFKVTKKTEANTESTEMAVVPPADNSMVFSGTLESFDSSCFHDGECFAVIDGRKVTVLVGRSEEPVGGVHEVNLGVMQEYIGKRFEVYAQALGNDSYTLYGNTSFYIRPL